jgi:predicted Zn-dependent protease
LKVFKLIVGSLGAILFLGVGFVALVRPDSVRGFILNQYRQALASAKREELSFLLKVVPGARVFRIYGVVCLATALVIIFALARS